jgi:hypothetical protein
VNRLGAVILTTAAIMLVVGCGGGKGGSGNLGVKGGDKLVVGEDLDRVRFEASYGDDVKNIVETDGDFIEIPKGTVLEVFVTPKTEAKIIEVVPVKLGDVTDAEAIKTALVNARFLRENFLYYTISIDAGLLGSKVTKME